MAAGDPLHSRYKIQFQIEQVATSCRMASGYHLLLYSKEQGENV
jgi:hypothetical protein